MRPDLIAHADWGTDPRKRWMATARLQDNTYIVEAAQPVGDQGTLLQRLREQASARGAVLAGFDFPIGVPAAYARRVGIQDFLEVLPELGQGAWASFYDVAESPADVSLRRPFYPQRPGGTRQAHLLEGLGFESIDELRRRCERARPGRRAAAPLFWTLGGQQVGKAAITGWREVIGPALRARSDVTVWPFAGTLDALVRPGITVIAETYPAEVYGHLGIRFSAARPGTKSGKRVQADRRANAERIRVWTTTAGIVLDSAAGAELDDGFGGSADGEDRFDAVIGLLGMLEVVLGRCGVGGPEDDEDVCRVEGWILGQAV